MRMPVGRLLPAILRHLDAYADVAEEDLRDASAWVARRLFALLIAVACAFVALVMLGAWLLVLAWDTPWRAWAAAGLALGFTAAALALAIPVLRSNPRRDVPFFPRVRSELGRDRELIARAFEGRPQAGNGSEEPAGEGGDRAVG